MPSGTVKLLLDGQQRITSLYGIVRGQAPVLFEGNGRAFTGIYFRWDRKVPARARVRRTKRKDEVLIIQCEEDEIGSTVATAGVL